MLQGDEDFFRHFHRAGVFGLVGAKKGSGMFNPDEDSFLERLARRGSDVKGPVTASGYSADSDKGKKGPIHKRMNSDTGDKRPGGHNPARPSRGWGK